MPLHNFLIHRIYSKASVSKKTTVHFDGGKQVLWGNRQENKQTDAPCREYFLSYISFCSCGHFSPFHVGKQFIHGACGKGFPKNQLGSKQPGDPTQNPSKKQESKLPSFLEGSQVPFLGRNAILVFNLRTSNSLPHSFNPEHISHLLRMEHFGKGCFHQKWEMGPNSQRTPTDSVSCYVEL